MKVGIIRCMQTEDYCVASRDMVTIREKKDAFDVDEEVVLTGIVTCGGCPRKKAELRARL